MGTITKIAIHTQTEAEYIALTEFYEKQGLRWDGGESATESMYKKWSQNKENTCIDAFCSKDGALAFSSLQFYREKRYTIIPFKSFAIAAGIKFEKPVTEVVMTISEIEERLGLKGLKIKKED